MLDFRYHVSRFVLELREKDDTSFAIEHVYKTLQLNGSIENVILAPANLTFLLNFFVSSASAPGRKSRLVFV